MLRHGTVPCCVFVKAVLSQHGSVEVFFLVQASTIEDIPGRPQSLHGKVMETAEVAIQRFDPFSKIHQHVCGFHFYAHDITRQVRPTSRLPCPAVF